MAAKKQAVQDEAPPQENGEQKKPVHVVSYYVAKDTYIQASIWQRDVESNGSSFSVFDVSLRKRLKVNDEWKSVYSFRGSELPFVARCVTKAEDWILESRSKSQPDIPF